ncbi:putative lycopene cyclase [Nocardiopsis alba ATCC BAA-2165]|uniref:Putative lycopene cyclase n=1 Tax=Nocardiopsis alba (strain ATCC BAA-2165 / BE74) TaxID=1205910 RepID=J7LCF4_NOCAA|nr:putative lycopene cyclase [Nocardiopsis alba ATCC BAA-2165]
MDGCGGRRSMSTALSGSKASFGVRTNHPRKCWSRVVRPPLRAAGGRGGESDVGPSRIGGVDRGVFGAVAQTGHEQFPLVEVLVGPAAHERDHVVGAQHLVPVRVGCGAVARPIGAHHGQVAPSGRQKGLPETVPLLPETPGTRGRGVRSGRRLQQGRAQGSSASFVDLADVMGQGEPCGAPSDDHHVIVGHTTSMPVTSGERRSDTGGS